MSMVLNSQNFYLYTELTHKSDTSNSDITPNSHLSSKNVTHFLASRNCHYYELAQF